jgi:hypothetical protein
MFGLVDWYVIKVKRLDQIGNMVVRLTDKFPLIGLWNEATVHGVAY